MKSTSEILIETFLDFAPIGIIIFDDEFKITYVNESFFSFQLTAAFSKEEIIGKSIVSDKKIGFAPLSKEIRALAKGESFESEMKRIKSFDGNELKIIVKANSNFDEEIFKGGIVIIEDLKSLTSSSDEKFDYDNLLNTLSPISDVVLITNMTGEIIYSSSSPKILLSKNIKRVREIFSIDSEIAIKELYNKLKNENTKLQEANLPLGKLHEDILVNIKLVPINNKNSNTVLVLIKDVTEELESRIAIENELNELRRYQAITSSIVDAVIGVNFNGEIRFWNESSEKVFGFARSQVYGKYISIIFPSLNEDYFQILREELTEKKRWEGDLYIDTGEGQREIYDVRMGLTGDGDNKSIVILCSSITERYLSEKELRKSEEQFRNIITNSHEYICTINLNGKINYANPYFAQSFGYSQDELTEQYFSDLIDPEYLEDNKFEIIPEKLASFQSKEIPLIKRSGEIVFVLSSFATVTEHDGTPQYYIAVLTDVTEKKQAEKDLLLIKSVFEASQDGIAVTVNGTIILVNNSFMKMLGYESEDDLVGSNLYEFIVVKDRERIESIFNELEHNGVDTDRIDFDLVKKDGSTFTVADSVAKYGVDENMFLVSVLRDVTIEKQNREALLESEERYRSITENIEESLWTAEQRDGKLKVVLYTPAIKNITGFSSEEFLEDEKKWQKIMYPDDAETVLSKMRRLYADHGRNSDAFQYRIINNVGNIVWIENKINVIRNNNGDIQKIYGLVSDITFKKKAEEELKKSAENLKKLNEAKDRFLSIISHDLRTPFSSILGFTDYLLSEKDVDPEKQRTYIKLIQDSSKSMLSLVNSLLDFTRIQTGRVRFEPDRIKANTIIQKSFNMVSGSAMQKNITLKNLVGDEVFIHADATLLMQVFNNLISNAIKFTNPDGEIVISAQPNVAERGFEFRVKDNGIGIKEEDLKKLFNVDSKFSTPGTSGEKGSGLGLSLVQEIIQKHGGNISVNSEYGKGTEFIFTIPVSSMNILLVDDSKTDRILYSKLIKNFLPNYEIVEAGEGAEALDIIKKSPPAIVITDHYMTGMSGYDLTKQIKLLEISFKPPVIVLSSDITLDISEEYAELGVEFVFQKPVNLKSFKEALERSLKKAIYY